MKITFEATLTQVNKITWNAEEIHEEMNLLLEAAGYSIIESKTETDNDIVKTGGVE